MEKINQPNTKRYCQYMMFASRKDSEFCQGNAIQYLNRINEKVNKKKISLEYEINDLSKLEKFLKNEIGTEVSIKFQEIDTILVLVKLIEKIEDEQLMNEICSFGQNDTTKLLDMEAIAKLIQKVKNSLIASVSKK